MYQVRSVGTQPEARIVVTEGHIGWADEIFVMEKSHFLQWLWLCAVAPLFAPLVKNF